MPSEQSLKASSSVRLKFLIFLITHFFRSNSNVDSKLVSHKNQLSRPFPDEQILAGFLTLKHTKNNLSTLANQFFEYH